VQSSSPVLAASSSAILDEKPMVDEIESDEDVKMEREDSPRRSPPPAPVQLALSGVEAFFAKDTPKECWRYPLEAKQAARKAFQVVAKRRMQKEGKRAHRYRWRDDGLAVDWVRIPPKVKPADSDSDDEIQVLENPAPPPIPTFVLEDSPEPEPQLPNPRPSPNGEVKRWSPDSPPVAKRQRMDEPPEWQSTAGGWLDASEQSRHFASSSPAASTSALPERVSRVGSSVPPDALPGSSVPPEAARAGSTAPPGGLLEIQAQMQELEARMKELQDQMSAAMQGTQQL
jgi:hypothetical protein